MFDLITVRGYLLFNYLKNLYLMTKACIKFNNYPRQTLNFFDYYYYYYFLSVTNYYYTLQLVFT